MGAQDALHRKAEIHRVAARADLNVLQKVQEGRAGVPRHVFASVHHVVALQRRHRNEGEAADLKPLGQGAEVAADGVENLLRPLDQVHLVDGDNDVRDLEQRGDDGVAARLVQQTLLGVDEDDGEVGRAGAGDHIPGVLEVAGSVGHDELAARRGEKAVGDVDGDLLLALGAEAVGEQSQIALGLAQPLTGAVNGLQLVFKNRLGVVEQTADQRAFAVVYAARCAQAEQVHLEESGAHGQK